MNLNDNSALDENNLNYLNQEISNYDIFEEDSPKITENYFKKSKRLDNEYTVPYDKQ